MAKTKESSLFPFEDIMRQAQAGDQSAYASLLKEVSLILKGYLTKRVNSRDDVEDIIQEILLSIHNARHTYDTSRPFLPWMFAIAQFRLVDFLRRHYRQGEREMVDFESIEDHLADDVTEEGDATELANKALALLPPRQRHILHLLHVEGYTAKETGEKLGMSTSAVKVAAHRAYKLVREKFKGDVL